MSNMTVKNLIRYCETNSISLNEKNKDSSLIVQRIHCIQTTTLRDIPLEGVKWYAKVR